MIILSFLLTWTVLEPKSRRLDCAVSVEDDVFAVLLAADAVLLAAHGGYLDKHESLDLRLKRVLPNVSSTAVNRPHRLRIRELVECSNPGVHRGLHSRAQ